jgi:hypothetical protein
MIKVRAKTFPLEDQEIPARWVTGTLTRKWVSSLNYEQTLVDGVPVDPASIKMLTDASLSSQEE